jgi:signal transduction histidine kinase
MHDRRSSAREWSIAFGVWSTLAGLSILQTALYLQQRGQPIDWHSLAISRLLDWYTCLAFAPAYVWLIRRYAFVHGRRAHAIPIVLAATIAFVPVKYAVLVPVSAWVEATQRPTTVGAALTANFFTEMLFLGGIALTIYALELYRRVQTGQTERAQLDRELAEARLDALALQLQPHFLFNTLNGVVALIASNPRAAEDMLTDLSELLHRTLRGEGHEVDLETELGHLTLYLGIMHHRFGDRLVTRVVVDAAARRALVPKLLLQPIVENAIGHGLAAMGGIGEVMVHASIHDSRLQIGITDNGPGFVAGNQRPNGIGLTNTRRRLDQMYGNAHSLTIDARDTGTVLTIAIPYRPSSTT